MKLPVCVATLVFTALVASPTTSLAASTPASPSGTPSATPAVSLAGEYTGKWQSHGDSSGSLRLKLKQDGETWTAEASFTVEDESVKPKVKAVKVDGGKVELVFNWEFRGSTQETVLTGEASADTLRGQYESKASGESNTGTWSVKRG